MLIKFKREMKKFQLLKTHQSEIISFTGIGAKFLLRFQELKLCEFVVKLSCLMFNATSI